MKLEQVGLTLSECAVRRTIMGFSVTDQWRRALSFLNKLPVIQPKCRDILARKAFSEVEIDLGFESLNGIAITWIDQDVKAAFWKFCRRNYECQNEERLFRFRPV